MSDVFKLASGTAVAQLITLAIAPVLTRLFPPEAFGSAALFASVVAVTGVLACLCYESAIVLSSDDGDAANLLALCIGLACISALLLLLVMWIAGPIITRWANAAGIGALIWLLPVATLLQGSVNAMSVWNTRAKQFGRLAGSQVAGQVTASSYNVASAAAGHASGTAMICASMAGQGIALLALAGQSLHGHSSPWRSARLARMIEQLRRYRKFPIYTSWSALLNTASWQLPVLMLSAFFPAATVGFYALGFRVLQLPMSLLAKSVGQVFLQRAAVAYGDGSLGSLVEGVFQKLLVAGLLPCIVLSIIGRELFELAFGSEWSEAGVYVQLLAPWVLVWFVSSPLSSLYYVLGRQREDLFLQGWIVSSRVIALGTGGFIGDARVAVLLFACSGVLVYGYLVKVLFRFAELEARAVFRPCAIPLRDAALLGGGVLAVKLAGAPTFVLLGASAAALTIFSLRHHGRISSS
jgi:lipopolysaccharide exporter